MSETFTKVRYGLVGLLLLFCAAVSAQTISGNVKDANGEPVIGATIMEQGTQNGTVTDFDGNFTLKLQKGGNLNVSYVGMKSQVIKTAGKSSVNVTLEDDNTTLNDIVVVGYGTMKKSDLTGSVSSVNTEQLNAKGAASALGNLQGATPGVNISQTSGRVGGDGFNIEIRGKSSMNSDTKPIYVVDGVICDDIEWLNPQDIDKIDILKDASSTAIYGSRATAGVVMVTTKAGTTVKKDAKATISYDGYYGWTKAVRMPDFMTGDQFYNWRLMKFLVKADPNDTSASPAYLIGNFDQPLLKVADGSYLLNTMRKNQDYFDWPDFMTQGGSQQNHYLAVSGAAEKVNYHFGLGYNAEEGIYKGDEKKQFTFKGSVDAQINKWLNAGFSVNLANIKNKYANDYAVQEAFQMVPFVSPYYRDDVYGYQMPGSENIVTILDYNEDGTPVVPAGAELVTLHKKGDIVHRPARAAELGTTRRIIDAQGVAHAGAGQEFSGNSVNPVDIAKNTSEERNTYRALGNLYLEFKPMKGLSFKTTFSPNYRYYRHGYYYGYRDYEDPQYSADGVTYHFYGDRQNAATEESATYQTNSSFSWTWDNVLSYNTRIKDKHSINAMALFSSQKNTVERTKVAYTGSKASEEALLEGTKWYNLNQGTYDKENSTFSDHRGKNYYEDSMASWAMRLNYGYMDRYLFTGTVRWDGSSKFTKDNRWGCFPSLAFAWRMSEEEFIKKIDWISNLKLRLSYGVTGNCAGVGEYETVSSVDGSAAYYYPMGSTYYNGMKAVGVVDKNIKWEKSHEFNIGIDFGFLNNRINGSIDWYTKKSKDLLANVTLPLEAGGQTIYTNIGSVRNTGIEFALTGVIIQNKDWNWTVSTNWSHNKNKVLETIGNGGNILSGSVTKNYFVGESVNNVYTWEIGGIVSDRDMVVPDNGRTAKAGLTPGTVMKEYEYFNKTDGLLEGQPYMKDLDNDGEITDNDRKTYRTDPDWTGSLTSNLSWKNWDLGISFYTKLGGYVYSTFMGTSDYFAYDGSPRGRQKFNLDYYIPAGTLIFCEGVNDDGSYINPVYQETAHYGAYPFPNMGSANEGVGAQFTKWDEAKGVEKVSYLKCKNITLGYTFPKKWLTSWGCSHLRLYFTVTNPFVFTKYKGYDPEWADASLKQDGPSTVTYQLGASIKF